LKELIVVATSPGREEWAKDCSESIKRPHMVLSIYGYELGKIKWLYENTNLDRFAILQDSVVITNPDIFDKIWDTPGSICLHHEARHMSCYLGVYERKVLDKIDIPVINTKDASVFNESAWITNYLQAADETVCFDTDGSFGAIEPRHGRDNLIYSNSFLIKYRGNWGQLPFDGSDPQDAKEK